MYHSPTPVSANSIDLDCVQCAVRNHAICKSLQGDDLFLQSSIAAHHQTGLFGHEVPVQRLAGRAHIPVLPLQSRFWLELDRQFTCEILASAD